MERDLTAHRHPVHDRRPAGALDVSVASAPALATPRADKKPRQSTSLWRDARRRFSRNKLALGSLAVVGLLLIMAVFAEQLAPTRFDYSVLSEANRFPSREHWLGTDAVGRDFLSRLIYGARVSLAVGITVQLFALIIGMTLGTLAG